MRSTDDADVGVAALDELAGLQHGVTEHEPVLHLFVYPHAPHRGFRRPAIWGVARVGDRNLASVRAQQRLHAELFNIDG